MHLARVIAVVLVLAPVPLVAAPAMSRGQQFFSMSHQECLTRATAVLQQAGYHPWESAGNGPWGSNGIHSAIIFCEPHSNGQEVVDIAVASESSDGNVPGAERVRLQQLMDNAGGGSPCPSNAINLRGTAQQLTCWCSPESTRGGTVWGSDVYTDDSVICRAAVHAGVIGGGGGTVRIRILPGMQSYMGSQRNGVESTSYESWHGSYRFE